MNNNRLSTYNLSKDINSLNDGVLSKETELNLISMVPLKVSDDNGYAVSHKDIILLEKINSLLSRPSNFEVTSNGKIFIKSEQKFFKGRGNVEIEAFDKDGVLINSFDNMEIAANFFNVKKHIIKYRLDSGSPLILNDNSFKIKEVYFKRAIETLL